MNIKLDTVLTVAIGRLTATGRNLSDDEWRSFRADIRSHCAVSGTIVAETTGDAIGSDGINRDAAEETAVFVVVNVFAPDQELRPAIAETLKTFGASSACFAFDRAHEPVFATVSGYRPDSINDILHR